MDRETESTLRDGAGAADEGSPDDGDGPRTVAFGYRGEHYEIELDEAGRRALEAVLERYINAGRSAGTS